MRTLTHKEYEAIKASRLRAYRRAQKRAQALWGAYERGHTTALPYAMRAIRKLDYYYLAMVAPMPTHIED